MARPRKKRSSDQKKKSKPDRLDPNLMANICFEVKYLSGKNKGLRTKGQILNEYGISYDSYYNWLKKLEKNLLLNMTQSLKMPIKNYSTNFL